MSSRARRLGWGSRVLLGVAVGGVFVQLVLNLAGADPENRGRLRRRPSAHLEGFQNGKPLDLVDARSRDLRRPLELGFGRDALRQMAPADTRVVAQNDRPFDRVLELAHVARPAVARQKAERVFLEAVDALAV